MGPASVGKRILDYLVKEMPWVIPPRTADELHCFWGRQTPRSCCWVTINQSGDNPMKPVDRTVIFSMIITIWLFNIANWKIP